MAIGGHDSASVAVVFKLPGAEGLSVISMLRASRKERAIHDEA